VLSPTPPLLVSAIVGVFTNDLEPIFFAICTPFSSAVVGVFTNDPQPKLVFMFPVDTPYFTTITCLQWKNVLRNEREKEIIIRSLRFMVENHRMIVSAFVIMHNHMHLIQQPCFGFTREDNQRDFLKYTSQQMLWNFKQEQSPWLKSLYVDARDRRRQVWERDSLNVSLFTPVVMDQKLAYIHQNPVKAGIVQYPEDYRYSSAAFYLRNQKQCVARREKS